MIDKYMINIKEGYDDDDDDDDDKDGMINS